MGGKYNQKKIGFAAFVVFAILLALYLLGGCLPGRTAKLTIGPSVSNPYVAPVWIAEHKGFFQAAGLAVEIKEFFGSGVLALTAMEAGGPDIVMPANLTVVFRSVTSDKFAVFAGFGWNDDFCKVLVRQDKGIKSPADLRGKKIGVVRGTTAHNFLRLFLQANHLKISDVEIVYLQATDYPQALAEGRVAAISAWEPYLESAKRIIGATARAFPSKGVLNENFYFVARKDFIQDKQAVLVKFLKAIERGNRFLREHPLESIDIVSRRSEIEKLTLISQWRDYEFGLYLDQAILASLQEQADWAIANGLVDAAQAPDYRGYVYPGILSKVKPESVTITR